MSKQCERCGSEHLVDQVTGPLHQFAKDTGMGGQQWWMCCNCYDKTPADPLDWHDIRRMIREEINNAQDTNK